MIMRNTHNNHGLACPGGARKSSPHDESFPEGIIIRIDGDDVTPVDTGPAFDAGYDGSEIPNPRYSLDPAGELAADIALVYKNIT